MSDLVVVGGGMAGACTAITAARAGIKVVLVQDRPVLGGNASSEVRLWILGATSHGGNNNRWAREGGVIDEILVENCYRNPEGNAVIFDTVLLEKVVAEPNITLLLNTSVHDLRKNSEDGIECVSAFCSQNSTLYELYAPMFCDASGDGVVAFMAGAAFRMGAESVAEFGELLAPERENVQLLGHSIFFYTRETEKPVRFVKPSYALDDITKIPRYRRFSSKEHGCELWWIEFGGNLDTVHDSEVIKWELWRVIYGVWDYIKNSGEFPDASNKTLEWVGTVPGKRESRRFEGDYMLTQQDVVDQRTHYDAVSFGGWAIDHHPADGVYSSESPCVQWHSKGVYQIPYRCLYSRNVSNLFLAGRIISASHIAFGSSRVMATCAHSGQAVGMAAAICKREELLPRDLASKTRIRCLQTELLREGQWIPGLRLEDSEDLVQHATITSSSEFKLSELPLSEQLEPLNEPTAMIFPVQHGKIPRVKVWVEVEKSSHMEFQLRTCSRKGSFTPDAILERQKVLIGAVPKKVSMEESTNGANPAALQVAGGGVEQSAVTTIVEQRLPKSTYSKRLQEVCVEFTTVVEDSDFVFCCLMANPEVSIAVSDHLVTGITKVVHRQESRVSKGSVQTPPADSGIEEFEFWTPRRRPEARNLAMELQPPLKVFSPENVANGIARPWRGTNAWVADLEDPRPTLCLRWNSVQRIDRVELVFDTDADHPMESVLMQHPETVMPFCVREFAVFGQNGALLHRCTENHQTRCSVLFDQPVFTDQLTIELVHPSPTTPASLFEVRCYGSN